MRLEEIYGEFRDRADFYVVYIREAHPTDGWMLESNFQDEVVFSQPQTAESRAEVASTCMTRLALSIPALIDSMDNSADRAFNAWPERLYVLAGNRVIYQGGKGPYDFDPEELAGFLEKHTADAPDDV